MNRSVLVAALAAVAVSTPVAAAPAETARVARSAEAAPAIQPVAVVERAEDATCSRIRRRLWLEGEGWIVRRITTCR